MSNRDTFLAAVEAYNQWRGGPLPVVEVEGEARRVTLADACRGVWRCTDIMPGLEFEELLDNGLEVKRRTYAACARAMSRALQDS